MLKILAFDMISIHLVGYSLIWIYQKIMMNRGLDNAYLGFISAGMTLTQLIIIANFMKIDKIIGSKKTFLMLSAVVPSIFMILLGSIESLSFSIIFVLIAAISLARKPYFSSHFNKHLPDKIRATVISAIGMIQMITITLINPFIGMMIDWNINFSLIIIGIFGLGATILSRVEEGMLNE